MVTKIQEVYLSSDYQKAYLTSPLTDSTDVIVLMQNGERYVASFFTYEYVKHWKIKEKDSEEDLYGQYFWAPNMIIVDDCSKENITKVIHHLIDEGDFKLVFKLISSQ